MTSRELRKARKASPHFFTRHVVLDALASGYHAERNRNIADRQALAAYRGQKVEQGDTITVLITVTVAP